MSLETQVLTISTAADLREAVLERLLVSLNAVVYEQGIDNTVVRESRPFDFGLTDQPETLTHLALGCIVTSIRHTGLRSRRGGQGIQMTAQLMVRLSYRLRFDHEDADYNLALTLLGRLGSEMIGAPEAIGVDSIQYREDTLALDPIPRADGRSGYIALQGTAEYTYVQETP